MNATLQFETHLNAAVAQLKLLRFLIVAPAALVTTFLLIWGMERLISANGDAVIQEPEQYEVPDPVWVEPPPPVVVRDRPQKPVQTESEPDLPKLDLAITPDQGMSVPFAGLEIRPVAPGMTHFGGDSPVATMLVQPAYPASAANRGLEGYVDVQFDVAATGATENIVVLAAVPPQIFERETIKAVKRWKFSPVVKDGRAVPYKGMVQRVNFEMEKP